MPRQTEPGAVNLFGSVTDEYKLNARARNYASAPIIILTTSERDALSCISARVYSLSLYARNRAPMSPCIIISEHVKRRNSISLKGEIESWGKGIVFPQAGKSPHRFPCDFRIFVRRENRGAFERIILRLSCNGSQTLGLSAENVYKESRRG